MRNKLTSCVGWAGLFCGAIVAAAAEPSLSRYRYEQPHMGMLVEVVLYSADEHAANNAAEAVFARFQQLNSILSDYDPNSELSRLSATAGSEKSVPISQDLWFVLSRAQALAEQTDGAFDVTVGPIVKLWRRARRAKELPAALRLAEAQAAVGYRSLVLDETLHTARLLKPGMRLDLGGIAAGYAVDEGLTILRERGITRALINASGDVGVSDPPPGTDGWRLALQPDGKSGESTRYLLLANAAVTTSGDAYQFVELDGHRYSHIVDPKTGLGLTTRMSATIVAKDCITADSLATAVCVLGPDRGMKLIEEQPDVAVMITIADDDKVREVESSRFTRFVEPESTSE